MPELKTKGRKRSTNPNRSAPTLQVTALIYLNYHDFALQEHLLTACKTNVFYLNNYILPNLLKENQIIKETARNKKIYKITEKGKDYAEDLIGQKNKQTQLGTSIFLAGIDLELLRNL